MKKFNSVDDFLAYKPDINDDEIKVLIGMGSCGIAAGADKVYNIINTEIEKRGLKSIKVDKVGCLGLCFSEPNVEIKVPGLPDVLYGKVDERFAVRILEEHIGDKKIINENIYDKPYIDVLELN